MRHRNRVLGLLSLLMVINLSRSRVYLRRRSAHSGFAPHWLWRWPSFPLLTVPSRLQQPIMLAVYLDIGGLYASAMVGAMNMASQAGAFLGSLVFGYLVARTGSYNVAFLPMSALLLLGTWLWSRIDPAELLTAATASTGLAVSLAAQAD